MTETHAGFEPVIAADLHGRRAAANIALHAVVAAIVFITPFVEILTPAVFINAGLRNGRKGVWGAILGATLLLSIVGLGGSTSATVALGIAGLLRMVLGIGLPSVFAYSMVRRGSAAGNVVLGAIVVSIFGFVATEATMRFALDFSPYNAIVSDFRSISTSTIAMYGQAGMPKEVLETMRTVSATVASTFMPFLLIAISVLTFVFSLAAIPRLPAGRIAGDVYRFRNLSLPDGLLFAFVAGGLSPLASGDLRVAGLNLLAIVVLLYVVQGFALFRALLVRLGVRGIGSIFAWGMLLLLTLYGVAPFFLFLAGLFDPFFDFRKFNRKDDSDESDFD